ncbi:MAG TPA: TIGR00725 family protein [Solirubrobacteraceae bacterium]|nr:TIGR00725 family protein [Solirubrobacteraceae bacterium]
MAYVAVVGPGDASPTEIESAELVGRAIAERGHVLVCGGLGGVMEAAARGASKAGGTAVGILPGNDRAAGNEWLTIAIPTGLGELRNGLVIRAADVVIAVGGAYGTLSEVALALKTGVPVIGLESWDIDGIERVDSPEDAVARATARAGS